MIYVICSYARLLHISLKYFGFSGSKPYHTLSYVHLHHITSRVQTDVALSIASCMRAKFPSSFWSVSNSCWHRFSNSLRKDIVSWASPVFGTFSCAPQHPLSASHVRHNQTQTNTLNQLISNKSITLSGCPLTVALDFNRWQLYSMSTTSISMHQLLIRWYVIMCFLW